MMSTLVRFLAGILAVSVLLVAAACAPAASPGPTATPPKSAATTAPTGKPSQATAPTPASKAAETPAAKPAASADWQAEWDKILASAKKEGKVVVGGARGEGFTTAVREFNKAYPEIKLDYTAASGADFAPKILAERNASMYLWDVYLGGSTTMLDPLMPAGVFEPLRPNLLLPEVLDNSKWRQGFDEGWQDAGHKYIYAFLGYISKAALVNWDVSAAAGLKAMDDLLDPKLKGMIVWQDPRVAGSGNKQGGNFYVTKGENWYRKLLANIVPLKDARMVLERVVRGGAAVAVGSREDDENEFRKQGLLKNAEYLDDGTNAVGHVTGGSGDVAAFDRPPNPNAQMVFINWLLSKQGQEAYAKATGINSRRLDVAPADQGTLPRADVKYIDMGKEEMLEKLREAQKVAEDALR